MTKFILDVSVSTQTNPHVLTDLILQCALYQREKEVVSNSEISFIMHCLQWQRDQICHVLVNVIYD